MTTNSDTEVTRRVTADPLVTLAQTEALLDRLPSGSRRGGLGLGLQFFLLAAALLAVTLALTVLIAAWRSSVVAERDIREDLARVPEVFAGYASSRAKAALEQVQSLAREPGTQAIFADEVDLSTRLSFAVEDAPTMLQEAGTVFLFDRFSRVLARSDRTDGSGVGQAFAGVGWVASVLDTWQGTTAFIRERDALAVVAAAPVISGEGDGAQLEGVLAVTFPYDAEILARLQALTRGELALVVDAARRGEPVQPSLSLASPGLDGPGLLAEVLGSAEAPQQLFGSRRPFGPTTVRLDGDDRELLAVPIESSSGEVLASLLVTRSRREEMASFFEIRSGLMIAGSLMLALSLPASFVLGRRIARPLRQLAAGAESIRDGRLELQLPTTGGGEVRVLANAFSAMVDELREKAALEKLLADLRARAGETGGQPTAVRQTAAAAGEQPMPGVGDVIGDRYTIRSELGRGGMGVVFRASDLELDEEVALKVMLPGAFAQATEGVAKLKQEVRLARRISHPNVVRVHDLVESDGLRCLSMEYVPGMTLLKLLRQHGKLALAPGLQIAKQLCRGLAAVHAEGIVHRDLKPQNIMVLPNGVVKLMDFGVSSGRESSQAGGDRIVIGTPAYMSPEQCRGEELDVHSDLYSLGIVLWEMFVGRIPFSAESAGAMIQQQLNVVPPPLRELRAEVPQDLDRIVTACLAKQPLHRPASATVVYQSLREILVTEW